VPFLLSTGAPPSGQVASIHGAAEKGYSRKLGFRYLPFSETPTVAPVLLAQVPPDRTPLHRTGYERYSPRIREMMFSETELPEYYILGNSKANLASCRVVAIRSRLLDLRYWWSTAWVC
jgi:hypothetical protein